MHALTALMTKPFPSIPSDTLLMFVVSQNKWYTILQSKKAAKTGHPPSLLQAYACIFSVTPSYDSRTPEQRRGLLEKARVLSGDTATTSTTTSGIAFFMPR